MHALDDAHLLFFIVSAQLLDEPPVEPIPFIERRRDQHPRGRDLQVLYVVAVEVIAPVVPEREKVADVRVRVLLLHELIAGGHAGLVRVPAVGRVDEERRRVGQVVHDVATPAALDESAVSDGAPPPEQVHEHRAARDVANDPLGYARLAATVRDAVSGHAITPCRDAPRWRARARSGSIFWLLPSRLLPSRLLPSRLLPSR